MLHWFILPFLKPRVVVNTSCCTLHGCCSDFTGELLQSDRNHPIGTVTSEMIPPDAGYLAYISSQSSEHQGLRDNQTIFFFCAEMKFVNR